VVAYAGYLNEEQLPKMMDWNQGMGWVSTVDGDQLGGVSLIGARMGARIERRKHGGLHKLGAPSSGVVLMVCDPLTLSFDP
jgi:hypothetical protein